VRRLAKVARGWDAHGVLERFTDGASKAVYLAIEEANELTPEVQAELERATWNRPQAEG